MNSCCVFLVIFLFGSVSCRTVCSERECYICEEESCHLTCQGKECSTCPDGECCKGPNCNVCVRSLCCADVECNKCVSYYRDACVEENCDSFVMDRCNLTDNTSTGSLLAGDYPVKTTINLRNVINVTNVVDTPINISSKNIEDVSINFGNSTVSRQSYVSCCNIIHPRECYNFPNVPREVCFTRRHSECTKTCGNSTDLLVRRDYGDERKCVFVGSYPFFYCGYVGMEDCSSCYVCEEDEDPVSCLEDSGCSTSCKDSILPSKFYNKPYHIRKNSTSVED